MIKIRLKWYEFKGALRCSLVGSHHGKIHKGIKYTARYYTKFDERSYSSYVIGRYNTEREAKLAVETEIANYLGGYVT